MFSGTGLGKPDPVLLSPTVKDLTVAAARCDSKGEQSQEQR